MFTKSLLFWKREAEKPYSLDVIRNAVWVKKGLLTQGMQNNRMSITNNRGKQLSEICEDLIKVTIKWKCTQQIA